MKGVSATRRVCLYLVITAGVSSLFWALIALTGHVGGANGAYELGLMWSPALGAVLACRLSGLPLQSLGWSWGKWKWQWLSFGIPLAYTVLAYGLVWATDLGGFPNPAFVLKTRADLGWPVAPDWLVLLSYFLLIGSAGMVMSLAFALGEEIGWRGFLSPHLTEIFGLRAGAVVTGLIWAAWHLPLVFLADYNSTAPIWFALSCFLLLLVAMSGIMAWLRIASGSLWTGAIFHASHNQFIQVFFTPVTLTHGKVTAYAIDEFGFALPIVVLIFAVAILRRQSSVIPCVSEPASSTDESS